MKLHTRRLGDITIDPLQVVTFPLGLPGFEQLKDYVFLQTGEATPFSILQSVEDGEVSFIVTNPFLFVREYEFDLPATAQEELKVAEEQDVMIWSIVTIRQSINDATLNLQAPVVVNKAEKLGKQVILHDSPYQTKQPLLPETQVSG